MTDTPNGANGRLPAGKAIGIARDTVAELLGKAPEGVSGVNRSEEGWSISLDVVELSRIPPSTDLLATYDVTLDDSGELVDLVRTRRYMRNQASEE
jgi:hypothetical protein